MKRNQNTLIQPVSYQGNGLHSGLPVSMTLCPAHAGSGICFRRTDLPDTAPIPAAAEYVTNTLRATTLENGPAKVFTVEHILSALYAMQIDNCLIEMNAAEPPVADGGALTFTQMIRRAGILAQDEPVRTLLLPHEFSVYEGPKFIVALPYPCLRITYTSINSHPMLGTQVLDITITPESYEKEIAGARTIGFTWELEALKKLGLGKGGTVENAVVYSKTGCLSKLHWPDELVRHKILDILGDISLVGPVNAHIIAVLSSHKLNAELASKLLDFRRKEEL